MSIIRCNIITNEVGVKQYIPFAIEDDTKAVLIDDDIVVFNVFPKGDKIDLRSKPPFYPIIPCPYCETENDRKHDITKHTHSKLTPEDEVKALAKEIEQEYNIVNCNGDLTVLAAEEFLDKKIGRINPKTRTDRIKEIMAKRSGGLKGWDPRITRGDVDYYGKSIKQIALEISQKA